MSIDFLEDLQDAVDRGVEYFACPGVNVNEWYIAQTIDELKPRAKRTAEGEDPHQLGRKHVPLGAKYIQHHQ